MRERGGWKELRGKLGKEAKWGKHEKWELNERRIREGLYLYEFGHQNQLFDVKLRG